MRVSERRSPTFPRRLAASRACGGGVRLFLTTSQVPALIWELFISCQKTAFPCNCRRKGCGGEWGVQWYGGSRGEGEEFGFKMSPGLGTASPGLKS